MKKFTLSVLLILIGFYSYSQSQLNNIENSETAILRDNIGLFDKDTEWEIIFRQIDNKTTIDVNIDIFGNDFSY